MLGAHHDATPNLTTDPRTGPAGRPPWSGRPRAISRIWLPYSADSPNWRSKYKLFVIWDQKRAKMLRTPSKLEKKSTGLVGKLFKKYESRDQSTAV